eukprot:CAMPEP_0119549756 /NCGR_PEP_ID=MMETSP1352-20130426/3394_1 /TAXON_ID=265584 /ORGANISM="Stauroneis constricta, Strain CCMP1120" /LENGTH=57 /DNA_ID=CAMNT_0007595387 /DNA_START=80 /DNA_END=250 /DNA_ORIENTATION=+
MVTAEMHLITPISASSLLLPPPFLVLLASHHLNDIIIVMQFVSDDLHEAQFDDLERS